MSGRMTTRERFRLVYEHKQPARVPFLDGPWGDTVTRWHREGLPEDVHWVDHFGLDHVAGGPGGDRLCPQRTPGTPDEVAQRRERS